MSAELVSSVKVNPFYVRKMATYLRCFDQDRSGKLTREDVKQLCRRWQDIAQHDTLRERQARRKIMGLWGSLLDEASKEVDITPEVFAKCIPYRDREVLIASSQQYGDVLFDLIDLNADGEVSLREFTNLHRLFLLNEKTAAEAFKALDKENKGYIVQEDFIRAVIDFFLPDGEKPISTSIIFGPLVD